jgi:outer membrane protein OmpA-like peptidoglycan-associated protein
MKLRWIVLPLLALIAACSLPDNAVVLIPDDSGSVGQAIVTTRGGQTTLTQANAVTAVDDASRAPTPPTTASDAVIASVFANALGARPRAPRIFIVNFVAGQAEPLPDSRPQVVAAIDYIRTLRGVDISVVGHADATGSADVNRTLALQRAERIRDDLVAGGVDAARIQIASFGSNVPLVPAPQGVPEPRNRRVEINVR